jgi:murein DD-endopeptidase MepM/ murein hydrolase activator NlpD
VLVLLAAAGAAVPPAPAAAADVPAPLVVRYRAPTAFPVRVARGFVGPALPWAPGHRGIDLDMNGSTEVLAPAAGTVTFAGTVVGRGVVTIAHADGRRSSLEPVSAGVVVGQRVEAGDAIGTLAAEGSHCTPSCLHWGVREGLVYLDPLTLLPGGGPVVLLPDGE